MGIFKKPNFLPKVSGTASNAGHSASNISLDDEDYVTVPSPNTQLPSAPSTKLGLPPLRRRHDQDQQQSSHLDTLLELPPRRSSLFQNHQDDSTNYSTQSLPDGGENLALRRQPYTQQVSQSSSASAPNTAPKKSLFGWKSNRDRSKSSPPVKQPSESSSFNLKSFRHVRPESPSSNRPPSPVLPPIPTPTPTLAIPSPPVPFLVTSRRPRDNSRSDLSVSLPDQPTTSQQKMAAGAFRQAARRSATSLSLTDSPALSPVSPTRNSLDDRPPPSLLPPSQVRPNTPTRPPRAQPPPRAAPSSFRAQPSPTPRIRTNAFTGSSSSSTSSEEENRDENSDTTDDGMGLSRKKTIKPRLATPGPPSTVMPERVQRTASPLDPTPPRAQSSLGVYGPGARQRASLSVGALNASAQEARASIAIGTSIQAINPSRPLRKSMGTSAPAFNSATSNATLFVRERAPATDTSESASESASDEDAPLSSLVPPRRPGTVGSSHSSPGPARKPLIDLDAPSTLTGRPVRAPPPMTREENVRPKGRVSIDFDSRVSTQDLRTLSPASSPQRSRISQTSSDTQIYTSQGSGMSQVSLQQDPKASSAQQNPRNSQMISRPPSRPLQRHILVRADPSTTQTGLVTRSNLSPPSAAPPMRPFARRESPASSTGDSSSGKAPLTPRDGSDLGGTRSSYSVSTGQGHPGHRSKPAVTFEDEQGRDKGKLRERDNASDPQEARLRERRRTEARAAIELGNVVNGPPPVDEDDLALGPAAAQPGWGHPVMQIPVPPFAPMYNMSTDLPMPPQTAFGFNTPPPGVDAAYLAAHQQAMAIAKQAFQYTVAQHALAAANDEWERNSNAGAQWGGSQWGANNYGLGLGMGMRTSAMFPPAPRSMYAGSVGIGGGGGAGAPWGGTGSVYGETFGPARQSVYSQVDFLASVSAQQRPPRPRTLTAPSASASPVGTGRGRAPAPPSSFRGLGR